MYFDFDLSHQQFVIYEVSLVLTCVALGVTLLRIIPLIKKMRARATDTYEPSEYESAAVLVYSKDEATDLEELLPALLDQDYPADFEVIVVNEGDSQQVREVVTALQAHYRNLYLTSTPDGARNLSRKKLAITLGIKATRQSVVVLTTAGARVSSERWLRQMMRHFEPGGPVEVVLGFASPGRAEGHSFGACARWFDHVYMSCRWLSPALTGHPWRGTEHNLAYRRDLFFRNKGFSRHLNLRHGDDDIFISEIARGYNTVVELSDDSHVEVPGANSRRSCREAHVRRFFTEGFIRHRPRVIGFLGSWAYLLSPLVAICGAVMSPYNWVGWCGCGICLLLWYLTGLSWMPAFKILKGRPLSFSIPLLAATRPLRQAWRSFLAMIHRGKRYTWE